jgi:hypothetical protein
MVLPPPAVKTEVERDTVGGEQPIDCVEALAEAPALSIRASGSTPQDQRLSGKPRTARGFGRRVCTGGLPSERAEPPVAPAE